ncbi:hypothetical protein LSTR_LSTR008447 [Laodelphax striatellus]|uniref:Uncharacterized protein n=1 Tax=Laodelphax striatellus TaxID=195883 RepID=A0A482XYX9_LAOST|nr:hypothetical protein LSTR_LSTR008447 [Laodelphax striatellus]
MKFAFKSEERIEYRKWFRIYLEKRIEIKVLRIPYVQVKVIKVEFNNYSQLESAEEDYEELINRLYQEFQERL